MSRLDNDRAELQTSVEMLEDLVGTLRDHDLLPTDDRVATAWTAFADGIAVWIARFDEAVLRLSHVHRTATQTDAEAADALARLA